MVEDPALGHLRHGESGGHERLERVGEFDGFFIGQAGEGFADVEGLAVAVVVPVIVRRENSVERELAGERPAGERQAHDERDPPIKRGRKQDLGGLLAEEVEDDLQRGEAGLLQADERLVHRLDAGTEAEDFPLIAEFAKPLEDVSLAKDFHGHAMELGEIEGFHAEALERILGGSAQAGLAVAVRIERGGAAELGGDEELVAGLSEEFPDELFTAAAAVDVGSVEEIHSRIDGSGEDGEAFRLVDGTPVGAAELPATETDFRDLDAGLSEGTRIHLPETWQAEHARSRISIGTARQSQRKRLKSGRLSAIYSEAFVAGVAKELADGGSCWKIGR